MQTAGQFLKRFPTWHSKTPLSGHGDITEDRELVGRNMIN
jgi:hypothetical protein